MTRITRFFHMLRVELATSVLTLFLTRTYVLQNLLVQYVRIGKFQNLQTPDEILRLFPDYRIFLTFPGFPEIDNPSIIIIIDNIHCCLLYTSPSPRDRTRSRMPSSA